MEQERIKSKKYLLSLENFEPNLSEENLPESKDQGSRVFLSKELVSSLESLAKQEKTTLGQVLFRILQEAVMSHPETGMLHSNETTKSAPILEKKSEWPQAVVELSGAWADFPTIDEIRSSIPQDTSREEW